MKRSIISAVVALTLLGGQALATYHSGSGPGFQTGSCALDDLAPGGPRPGSGAVLSVDDDYAADDPGLGQFTTIGAAVSAASPGDTILVEPGEYKEQVEVPATKPALRIRGTHRRDVQLNGENARQFGIRVRADRVVLENMTAHNYTHTAFFWNSVTGYMGRHLTAYSSQGYGLYALDARCGEMHDSFASGHADSGFYVGECFPCDAVIHDIQSTDNALGYSGTNAGGNLALRRSEWWDNGLGIVPNTLNGEAGAPQRGLTMQDNDVFDNNNKLAPGEGIQADFWGGGIVVAGGQGNQIIGNRVLDHGVGGIVLSPIADPPNPDNSVVPVYVPSGNMVTNNTVTHDPVEWPDAMDLAQAAASGPNNCWARNTFGTSAPPMIQTAWHCGLPTTPPGGDARVEAALVAGVAGLNGRDPQPWQTWPAPDCASFPGSCVNQPDDDGNGSYADDGAIDRWLPAMGVE